MPTRVTSKGQVRSRSRSATIWEFILAARWNFAAARTVGIMIEKADGPRPPSKFAKARGSAGPGMTTDQLMALLRGEPE